MKIAFISHGVPDDPRHFSGIPWHILQELRKQGHEAEAFHAEPAKWARSLAQFRHRLSLKLSHQPHHFEADSWILQTRSVRLDAKIQAFQPEAVLCVGFPEAAIAISANLPLYVWMDAMYPTVRRCYEYFQIYYSEQDSRTLQRMESCVLLRTKKIWLSSEWAANETKKDFPKAAGQVGVQSFGANLESPPNMNEVEQAIKARNLAEPTLLFLVNEWERKGGDRAVETVRRLRQLGCRAKLAVIGLVAKPPTVPNEPWLEWVGRLDKNQPEQARRLGRYLSESAFLLLPTNADCTPIACHEAAAHGLPVLATNVGGLASTVDQGATGMLWSVEQFTKEAPAWVAANVTNPNRYATMAMAARVRFETKGNWAVNVRAVVAAMQPDLGNR